MSRRDRKLWAWIVAAVATVYAMAALGTFRWRHPWMTETELFRHIPEALVWSRADGVVIEKGQWPATADRGPVYWIYFQITPQIVGWAVMPLEDWEPLRVGDRWRR